MRAAWPTCSRKVCAQRELQGATDAELVQTGTNRDPGVDARREAHIDQGQRDWVPPTPCCDLDLALPDDALSAVFSGRIGWRGTWWSWQPPATPAAEPPAETAKSAT